MKRCSLYNKEEVYDLIIVGGGIYGASLAYSAVLNGIRLVLLEKDDYSANTSANSQKVIHGGFRYLQKFDVKRVVESIRERQRFYYLFPHLVKPLPCLLPISGWGTKGREAFHIALLIYRLIQKAVCRGKLARHIDKQPRLLSKNEVTERFPHLESSPIRGGALWYDGLCVEPERIIISLLQGAEKLGAQIGNYMEVISITRLDDSTLAVLIYDRINESHHQVKTKKVALCTGSWFQDSLELGEMPEELQKLTLIRGMNVILPSLFPATTSLAAKIKNTIETRFLFYVPWKDFSIGGTHWEECPDPKSPWKEEEQTVANFHSLIQKTLPADPKISKALSWHVGYVPGVKEEGGRRSAADRILSHYKLVDREKQRRGDVLQVVGVKFTTAFDVVFKSLKRLFPEKAISDVLTFQTLPQGSPQGSTEQLQARYQERYQGALSIEQCQYIFCLFGNTLPTIVTKYLLPHRKDYGLFSDAELYCCLARYCVEEEMTIHLEDLVFRRLFPNTPKVLSRELLNKLAQSMAESLKWTVDKKNHEIKQAIEKWKTSR